MSLDNLSAKIDAQFATIKARFAGIDAKIANLDSKIAGIDKKLDDGFDAVKARDELMRALVGADAEAFEAQIVENGFGEDSGKSGRPG